MIDREEIFAYAKETFGTEPDYPWIKFPDYAVLRHKSNGKWYALIATVARVKLGLSGSGSTEIINLKCDPELKSEKGILPAYHMNKEHWITIVLDSPFPKERIYDLIQLSYDLTE